MRRFAVISVLAGAVASVIGQTIQIGAPIDDQFLCPGENFTAQIIQPVSPISCDQVGIALTIANCDYGACPTPDQGLGSVLYAGPWTPTPHTEGYYQNFTLQVPEYMSPGLAIFTVTHLCLLGAGPYPLLEYRNVSVIVL